MKKLIAASVLALLVLASSQQQASAWRQCKFSIGLNFECASGNNSCLWGLYRNGPTPDCGFNPYLQGPQGPAGEWHGPAPMPAPPVRPGASPVGPQNAYAGYYYYAPYYYPQAGYYYNPYQYNPNPYQYAGYQANNPFNYYLMSYPGYSQGLNFYGQ